MYGYNSPDALNPKNLLLSYSQQEIFAIALKEIPDLGKFYSSPFREDRNPGCFFSWYGNKLYFVDFADKKKAHRDCFDFVKESFCLKNFIEVGNFIVENIGKDLKINLSYLDFYNTSEKDESKAATKITFKIRNFERKDKLFWSQYGITEQMLFSDYVFPIDVLKIRKTEWKTIIPYKISYAITVSEDRYKIYSPYSGKRGKWVTNCTENDVGGLLNLPPYGEKLIITKSYKDCRVLRNQMAECIWFQNEGMIPSVVVLSSILKRFDEIFVFFDNDVAGRNASEKVSDIIFNIKGKQAKQIFSPYNYLKDPADIYSAKGENELKELLWKECHL